MDRFVKPEAVKEEVLAMRLLQACHDIRHFIVLPILGTRIVFSWLPCLMLRVPDHLHSGGIVVEYRVHVIICILFEVGFAVSC